MNVVEEVDNSKEYDSVEEDEGNISKPKTHMVPPPRVINKGHLVKNCCPYMHMRILT
jgi:hypothetical protein